MSNTVPGGAYQAQDGTWHDANGKPISERTVQRFFDLQRQNAKEKPAETDEVKGDGESAVTTVTPTEPVVAPPEEPGDEEKTPESQTPTSRPRGRGGRS